MTCLIAPYIGTYNQWRIENRFQKLIFRAKIRKLGFSFVRIYECIPHDLYNVIISIGLLSNRSG